MLVKYINQYKIKKATDIKILYWQDKQIINPQEEDFINAGYKQLVETPQPYYDEETQYLMSHYEEKGDVVVMKRDILEILEEDI